MAADSYWFKHNSAASRTMNMMKIRAIYGFAGIGIYWTLMEVLREQEGYVWSDKESDIQVLASIIGCEYSQLNNLLTDSKRLGLLLTNGIHFYSPQLIEDMVVWETKKKNRGKTKPERNDSGTMNGTGTDHERNGERIPNGSGNGIGTDHERNGVHKRRGEKSTEQERRCYSEAEIFEIMTNNPKNPFSKQKTEVAAAKCFKFYLNREISTSHIDKWIETEYSKEPEPRKIRTEI